MDHASTASASPPPRPVFDNAVRLAGCPVCSSNRIETLGALAYAAEPTYAGAPITLMHTPALAACTACGSWFTQQALPQTVAMQLYAHGRGGEHWKAPAFEEGKTADLVAAMRALLSPGMHVVDIGCNTGELLDFCRQHGAETTGIEPSLAAQQQCLHKGHRIAASLDACTGEMDLVLAFDLVEHLYDMPAFLRAARSALKPGGHLVMLTGDIESPTARQRRQHWWYLRYPEHIVFPSWTYWQQAPGFGEARRIRTYASAGYRVDMARRAKGAINLVLGRGNGLPLAGADHHLVILKRT